MVFVKDAKKEFYDFINSQRVLIVVNQDVDALGACRILQYLFRGDHILYTIIPVSTRQDMEHVCLESFGSVRYILLLNCGATVDIIDYLQPPSDIIFFICDSHRPIDIHNIYNQVQVRLLMNELEIEGIPEYHDVFRDDDDINDDEKEESDDIEPSDEEENSRSKSKKRRRIAEEEFEKRRERREWEQKRQELLIEYTEFSFYGTSSSLILFELAWKLSRETNDLLWLAICGVTEQYLNEKIDRDVYIESISRLQPHVSRLNHRPDNDENIISINCMKIKFEQELNLPLYRHWSLLESLSHCNYTVCKFALWTLKGKKRLQEFLADLGFPLNQCKQKFKSMTSNFQESIKDVILKHGKRYGIEEHELFFPSFNVQYGYKNRLCAADMVHTCEAYLESVDQKFISLSDNFLYALDNLHYLRTEGIAMGIELSKLQLKTLVSQVHSLLDMNQIFCAGPFLYTFLQQSNLDCKIFTRPSCLRRLAKFALEAYCVMNKKARALPMVLGTHLNAENDSMLVVGIPPIVDLSCKNLFGKAFEQAALTSNSRAMQEQLESNYIELKTEDKSKFFDTLISILQG